jgi:hypothetical protein
MMNDSRRVDAMQARLASAIRKIEELDLFLGRTEMMKTEDKGFWKIVDKAKDHLNQASTALDEASYYLKEMVTAER